MDETTRQEHEAEIFTVSSMRVSKAFFDSMIVTFEELGSTFTGPSLRMAESFFTAQINEADAHGIGSCDWAMRLSACVERLQLSQAQGISPYFWLDQMRAFSAGVESALAQMGFTGPEDLPREATP